MDCPLQRFTRDLGTVVTVSPWKGVASTVGILF
jgi:hypothetical protein